MSMHALTFQVQFPFGLCAGRGGQFNRLEITRDGGGNPILHGSSIAGVIRSGLAQLDCVDFFGMPAQEREGEQQGFDSPLQVPDCALSFADSSANTSDRTHHLRNRHTKSVKDGGLFSLESCPPGTTMMLTLWLDDIEIIKKHGDSIEQAKIASIEFLSNVHELFRLGVTMGGNAARGIGLAIADSGYQYRYYDTRDLDDHASLLDDHRKWRHSSKAFPSSKVRLP